MDKLGTYPIRISKHKIQSNWNLDYKVQNVMKLVTDRENWKEGKGDGAKSSKK